ncbi:MAG TPA: adenylyltransferase/cytidyltransferase family protein [Bryobacteraceae bacterium]|nr:adenylyltransferase/cytidyltransferase family protein [Bryobacteraceae bacterium]
MEFLSRPPQYPYPARLGILPGSFNPPTLAHLALAEAALEEMDEVILVLPRVFPHKNYAAGATFAQRAGMLRALLAHHPRLAAGVSRGGLFTEIAQECRAAYGAGIQLTFVCGRDAAERIVGWDYGAPEAIDRMLEDFQLLVAGREGAYQPPAHLRHYIRVLAIPAGLDTISASDVRRRIREGAAWQHLVPGVIVPLVREIYCPPAYSA